MRRHVLIPAIRVAMPAALAAALVVVSPAPPAGAVPGHPASPGQEASADTGYPWRVVAAPARPAHTVTPERRVTAERTLTLKATDLAGKPDTGGVVQVFNIDGKNVRLPGEHFEHGVAKFQVPAGHYFALASFGGLKNPKIPLRTVVVPQITVTGNTTVTVRETAASSEITMVTPRPATVLDTDVWLRRTTAAGPAVLLEGYFTSSQQIWFSPTHAKPALGTLRMSVNRHLESPPGRGVPYEYTLSYTDPPGTIPAQHYVTTARGLATINERFYQPVESTGGWAFNGSFPGTNANNGEEWFGFIEPAGPGLKLPGRLTEYAGGTGSARMEWSGQYGSFGLPTVLGEVRLLRPGEHVTDNWSAYPLHPGVNALLTSLPNMFWMSGANIPSAVRTGNTLQLNVDPFDDNQPGHQIGLVQSSGSAQATGTYQIDQNGTKIASGDAVAAAKFGAFYTTATLSPHPSTIRFSLDYTRTSADFPLSTATSTVWTFRSAPVTSGELPPGWSCVQYTYKPRGCAAEPMMTLRYAVAGLGLDGASKPGQQRLHLSVGHLQGAKASTITKASVSVSFDGGKTWQRAKMTGRGGSYIATFSAPAGAKVTLRTRAADAAGGSIAETITSAYQTGS
jgi:hypothetical protein